MLPKPDYVFWFATGSQDLYGDECLKTVAAHSQEMVAGLNASGALQSGKWQQVDGAWYYLNGGGDRKENVWFKSGGNWYYFGSDGAMVTGEQTIGGKTYVFNASGVMLASKWVQSGSDWKYVNASGAYATGWQKISGTWYWFDESGVMATGTRTIDGKTYVFSASGAMQANKWVQQGDAWTYLNSSGAYATGWQKIGGTWYYFNTSGVMQTGKQSIDGSIYFFNASGAMQAGKWMQDGGDWYYLTGSGAATVNKWLKSGGSWYYFGTDGKMVADGGDGRRALLCERELRVVRETEQRRQLLAERQDAVDPRGVLRRTRRACAEQRLAHGPVARMLHERHVYGVLDRHRPRPLLGIAIASEHRLQPGWQPLHLRPLRKHELERLGRVDNAVAKVVRQFRQLGLYLVEAPLLSWRQRHAGELAPSSQVCACGRESRPGSPSRARRSAWTGRREARTPPCPADTSPALCATARNSPRRADERRIPMPPRAVAYPRRERARIRPTSASPVPRGRLRTHSRQPEAWAGPRPPRLESLPGSREILLPDKTDSSCLSFLHGRRLYPQSAHLSNCRILRLLFAAENGIIFAVFRFSRNEVEDGYRSYITQRVACPSVQDARRQGAQERFAASPPGQVRSGRGRGKADERGERPRARAAPGRRQEDARQAGGSQVGGLRVQS